MERMRDLPEQFRTRARLMTLLELNAPLKSKLYNICGKMANSGRANAKRILPIILFQLDDKLKTENVKEIKWIRLGYVGHYLRESTD